MIYTHIQQVAGLEPAILLLGKQALLPLSYTCIHNYIQDTTRPKYENTGYYGSTPKALQSVGNCCRLGLTRCLTSGKLLTNKEGYECGSSEAIHYRSGMDSARKGPK